MKALLYISALFIIGVGCDRPFVNEQEDSQKLSSEFLSSEYSEHFNQPDFETVNLDSLQNFGKLLDNMERISCANKSTGITFTFHDTIYKLMGFTGCPTSNVISCHFNRNTLFVKNDSIKNLSGDWDEMVYIENLDKEIEKVSEVDYHFQFDKDVLKPALIHLYIENKYPISKTKAVLKEIVQQFEKINSEMGSDFFRYNINFERYSMVDIPPPPPPPEFIEELGFDY